MGASKQGQENQLGEFTGRDGRKLRKNEVSYLDTPVETADIGDSIRD